MTASFPHRHLLGIEGLSAGDLDLILAEAEPWIAFNRGARKARQASRRPHPDQRLLREQHPHALLLRDCRQTARRPGLELPPRRLQRPQGREPARHRADPQRDAARHSRHPPRGRGRRRRRRRDHGLPGDQCRRRHRRASDPGPARRADHPPADGPHRRAERRDLRRHRAQPRRRLQHPRPAYARGRGAAGRAADPAAVGYRSPDLHRSRRGHLRRRRGDDAAHPARADGGGIPRHDRGLSRRPRALPAPASMRMPRARWSCIPDR